MTKKGDERALIVVEGVAAEIEMDLKSVIEDAVATEVKMIKRRKSRSQRSQK